MVMSETRETNRNGKKSRGSSPSANSNNTSKPPIIPPAEDLTPETSDDENRKRSKIFISKSRRNFLNRVNLSDSKKNLGKPKNGKSEFEGEQMLLITKNI